MSDDMKAQRHPITADYLDRLRAEKERTGFAQWALLNGADIVPEGLSSRMIGYWLSGQTKTATREHLDFVLDQWARLPDKPPPITSNDPGKGKSHSCAARGTSRKGCLLQ